MSQYEMKEIMLDMRDRLIRIETKIEVIPEIQYEQKKHGQEILKARTSVKVLRWLFGVLLITVPATAAAIYKIFS